MGRHMEDLEYMLYDELDKIAEQGELTAGSLDTVQKLTHSLKSIKTIEAMDGYSGRYRGNGYEGSYAQRRDSMGRYSRRGYSRDGEKHEMLEQIEELKQTIEKMGD